MAAAAPLVHVSLADATILVTLLHNVQNSLWTIDQFFLTVYESLTFCIIFNPQIGAVWVKQIVDAFIVDFYVGDSE